MNPYTGDIMRVLDGAAALAEGFLPVPKSLERLAAASLGEQDHVRIDLRKHGPLQAWAKKKRKEKIAAKSRRANR